MNENDDIPPKIELRSSTMLLVEDAFLMLDETPLEDVRFATSGPPLL